MEVNSHRGRSVEDEPLISYVAEKENRFMEQSGRLAFFELVEARVAEWERNIVNLGHRMAKAKDDPETKQNVEDMKARLPVLAQKAKAAMEVPDSAWPDYKSEVDLMFENLAWLQRSVMRRLGGA